MKKSKVERRRGSAAGRRKAVLLMTALAACFSVLSPAYAYAAKRPYAYGYTEGDGEPTGPALADAAQDAEGGPGIAGISGTGGIARMENTQCPANTEADNEAAKAEQAALADNTLEFGEIVGRIENYNTSYRNTLSTARGRLINSAVISDLREEARELSDEADDLKEDGLEEDDKALYRSYREAASELRKKASKLDNVKTDSIETSLKQSRNKLIKVVQNQYITYENAKYSLNAARKTVTVKEELLNAARIRQAAGLAAEGDVLEAQNALLEAQKSAASSESKLYSAKNNILISLGWPVDADVTIEDIPAPDLSLIDTIRLEDDTQTAIASNYTLITTRKTTSKSTSDKVQKARSVETKKADITSSMNTLYANVISKRQAYDAAGDAWAKAQNDWNSAQIKHAGGMTGKTDFLQAEASYESAIASWKKAELDLISAMQNYDWAVAGIIS